MGRRFSNTLRYTCRLYYAHTCICKSVTFVPRIFVYLVTGEIETLIRATTLSSGRVFYKDPGSGNQGRFHDFLKARGEGGSTSTKSGSIVFNILLDFHEFLHEIEIIWFQRGEGVGLGFKRTT